jgi:hypothetical protein
MIAVEHARPSRMGLITLAVLLAIGVAIAYVLIGLNVLAVGSLTTVEKPAAIIFTAAASYLLGGLLIGLRRRALWVVGAMINALVMVVFFVTYQNRPDVIMSPGGLATKTAQLLLEVSLVYLLIAGRHHRHAHS